MLGAHGRLGEVVREVVHLLEREARQVDGEVAHDDDDVRLAERIHCRARARNHRRHFSQFSNIASTSYIIIIIIIFLAQGYNLQNYRAYNFSQA